MPDSFPQNQPIGGDDRSAKVEELLVSGLDYYFAGQHERAITVWTRVLFLDRNHARARAYIERARSALAERQRESEELIQRGIAAFDEGEAATARRLLSSALARGGPHDIAQALLERLNRLEPGGAGGAEGVAAGSDAPVTARVAPRRRPRSRAWVLALAVPLLALVGVAYFVGSVPDGFRVSESGRTASAPRPVRDSVPLPRSADLALGRARKLVAGGHLKEALSELETINPGDPAHPDAERLRADIQQSLLAGLPPLGGER